ncbi:hypothetical protein QUF99_02315 [Bacillus sp. DX4.1]|uniref:hypothetical protein n=1 Tax=Bacillus sp. DX4.1 TaxID=3055867 RepID=UPI0025A22F19|nr:hypothetical protein [Bacillus sp. DX4.1]MDM5186291.1 hypothetical protein [Bacillus sp. DX4.1]
MSKYADLIAHYGLDGNGKYIKEFQTEEVRNLADDLMRLLYAINQNDATDNYKAEKLELILENLKSIDTKLN